MYLVTGGAGFIGSHIARRLLSLGEKVRCLDLDCGGLEELPSDVDRQCGDIRSKGCLRAALEGVDYVLHQAALTSVPRSIKLPLLTSDINVSGTLNLLEAVKDKKIKRFVYASSSSVYGDRDEKVKSEDICPCPMSPYAVSKYAGELYCQSFHRIYGTPVVILRYFNVFGSGQKQRGKYASVIANFLTAAIDKTPATIYGDGQQTRDFTHVQNVVDANLLACSADGIEGEVFNIGCGVETSISELVDIVKNLIGCDLEAEYKPPRLGDVRHSIASIRKAKHLLGYRPTVSLSSGLRKMIYESALSN
jgi:nucleoside-diphosphate-sugar epimerase